MQHLGWQKVGNHWCRGYSEHPMFSFPDLICQTPKTIEAFFIFSHLYQPHLIFRCYCIFAADVVELVVYLLDKSNFFHCHLITFILTTLDVQVLLYFCDGCCCCWATFLSLIHLKHGSSVFFEWSRGQKLN